MGVLPGQINKDASVILMIKQKDAESRWCWRLLNPTARFNDHETILFDTAQIFYQFQKAKELKDATVQFMTDRLPAPSLNPILILTTLWPFS